MSLAGSCATQLFIAFCGSTQMSQEFLTEISEEDLKKWPATHSILSSGEAPNSAIIRSADAAQLSACKLGFVKAKWALRNIQKLIFRVL